jgi:hypothetical protein
VGRVSTRRQHRDDDRLLALSAVAGRSDDDDEPDYYYYYCCSNTAARNDPVGPDVVVAPAIAWYKDDCPYKYSHPVLGPIRTTVDQ